MKILVVYYSKTGNTKKVADLISSKLNADIEKVMDKKNRNGVINIICATLEAFSKKGSNIKAPNLMLYEYDLIIIGTPVWSWNITPAVRTFIENNFGKFNNVAFFCTMGTNGDINTFREMKKLCNKEPVITVACSRDEIINGNFSHKINNFIKFLKSYKLN